MHLLQCVHNQKILCNDELHQMTCHFVALIFHPWFICVSLIV